MVRYICQDMGPEVNQTQARSCHLTTGPWFVSSHVCDLIVGVNLARDNRMIEPFTSLSEASKTNERRAWGQVHLYALRSDVRCPVLGLYSFPYHGEQSQELAKRISRGRTPDPSWV